MSETQQDPWVPKGWVGTREVIDAFKLDLEAHVGGDEIGGMNPLPGDLAEIVDTDAGLVGFAIMVRPDYAITVPAGAHGMRPHIAQALLSTLTSGRAPGA